MQPLLRLTDEQVDAVLAMASAATRVDGTVPLSEHVLLHLRHGGDLAARHILSYRDGELAGYAHVDITDLVQGAAAELVVHPDFRQHGIGRTLAEAAVAASPDGRLRLWAHGAHPASAKLALSQGFVQSRILWQMRRSLLAPIEEPRLPAGIFIRSFQIGHDEDAWLQLNARAFSHHPEQGRWTSRDLQLRQTEPWFNPAGFFLAVRACDNRLLGFHWTKVHGGSMQRHGHEPIGEIYVLGVDPAAQGLGLGSALTLAGLRFLRAAGLSMVMLYVDASDEKAVSLYQKHHFDHWATDIQYILAK